MPQPPWGELVLTKARPKSGPKEVVALRRRAGRVADEGIAPTRPAFPNVLTGERL